MRESHALCKGTEGFPGLFYDNLYLKLGILGRFVLGPGEQIFDWDSVTSIARMQKSKISRDRQTGS